MITTISTDLKNKMPEIELRNDILNFRTNLLFQNVDSIFSLFWLVLDSSTQKKTYEERKEYFTDIITKHFSHEYENENELMILTLYTTILSLRSSISIYIQEIEKDYSSLLQESLKDMYIYIIYKIEAIILAHQNLSEERVLFLSEKILDKKEYLNNISYQPE